MFRRHGAAIALLHTLLNSSAAPSARAEVVTPTAPQFSQPIPYSAGNYPYFVQLRDLDGDHDLDMVVVDQGGGVNILLGTGSGSFQSAVHYGTGGTPTCSDMQDLNHDGKLDLVVTNYDLPFQGPSSLAVLLGNGDGTFGAATIYPCGLNPMGVAVGDLNGDGSPDVVTADEQADGISIFLNLGNGTLGGRTNQFVGGTPRSVALGDVNGDGILDVAVAVNASDFVVVMPGLGNGSFGFGSSVTTGAGPRFVVLADVNSDGRLDLVAANQRASTVTVRPGNGAGAFGLGASYTVATDPRHVAIGDLNGDGKVDLATANWGSSSASVLLGNGDATFGGRADFSAGYQPTTLAIGDVNGDERLDLAAANTGGFAVSVLLNVTPDIPPYTLSLTRNPVAGGSVTVSPAQVNYDPGTIVSLTAHPNPDWLFIGWSGHATGTDNPVSVTMNSNKRITASFTTRIKTITASAGRGGSIDPTGDVNVEYGADQTFTITPEAEHVIAHVLIDGVSVGPVATYTFTDVQTNHTIAASFDYCWPYEISYVDFHGFDRTTSSSDAAPIGYRFDNGRVFDVDARDASCWHVQPSGPLVLAGCMDQPTSVSYTTFGDCDVEKLYLSLTDEFTGERIVETSHIVLADYPLLNVSNWGSHGSLMGLLWDFAPVLRFHQGENYLPVRTEVNLHGAKLSTNGPGAPENPMPDFAQQDLTPEDLARYSWSFFTIDEPCAQTDQACALARYQEAIAAVEATQSPYCIYATAIQDPGKSASPTDDGIILQYWMNYYYNDFYFCSVFQDLHEGDWEHVTVALDADLQPKAMYFGAHRPETVKWGDIEKWKDTDRPIVYVALGAHGNYAHSGYESSFSACDWHIGNGPEFAPTGEQVQLLPRWSNLGSPGAPNRWVKFAGYWGTGGAYHDDNDPKIDGDASFYEAAAWRGPAFRKAWRHPLREEFRHVKFEAHGAVDLVVTDPNGREAGPSGTSIPLARYETVFADDKGDGSRRWVEVHVPDPTPGAYQVTIVPTRPAARAVATGGSVTASVITDWLGKPQQTIVLAENVKVTDLPPGGYRVVPDVPHVGLSSVIPSTWNYDNFVNPAPVEWTLSPGDEGFDVNSIVPESLRLNGTVPPILPIRIDGNSLIVDFPRAEAFATIPDVQDGVKRAVTLTGEFENSAPLESSLMVNITVLTATILARFIADVTSAGVRIQWEFNEPDQVVGETLERAPSLAGPWEMPAIQIRRTANATEAIDNSVHADATYYYRLTARFADGTQAVFGPIQARTGLDVQVSGLTGIFPNPMFASTRIDFGLARNEQVRVSVVDVAGREVAVLASERMPAGRYSLVWDGRARGSRLAAGVYFVRWVSESRTMSRRLVLLR